MAKTLITGAASGIGKALANRLSAAGHELVLVDTAAIDLPTALQGDVSSEQFWDDAAPALAGLTHAVINAGISVSEPIETLELSDWRRVMAVNLDGAFLTLRAAIRAIKPGKGSRAMVLTGSIIGIKVEPGTAAYGASKAGVLHLARIAAKELAADGIRVNAIAPGGVDTAIWDSEPFFAELVRSEGSRDLAIAALGRMATPLGRYATADEIAAHIDFLLSDDAAFITGAVLTSDGGYSL
jgi:2-keto-3-deoxy-L-fuconate dehydrogenase